MEEDSDDDSLLCPIISKSKTVPTPGVSSKLRTSHSDNLHHESDSTANIGLIDNGGTKFGHVDCNESSCGSVTFLKVVQQTSSVAKPDDNNNSHTSKIKLVSPKSKESKEVSTFETPISSFTSTNNSSKNSLKDSFMKHDVERKSRENSISKELTSTNIHLDNIDETNEIVGLAVPMDMKNVSKNTSNISNYSNDNTSCVVPDMIQPSFVPMTSIDLQSSASNDSDLKNGTFCSPIDEKLIKKRKF